MTHRRSVKLARAAAILALLGLALLIGALTGPLLAVLAFMSIGQLVGILAVLLYAAAVIVDLKHANVFERPAAREVEEAAEVNDTTPSQRPVEDAT